MPERFANKRAPRKPQERVSRRSEYICVSEAAEPRLVGYARVSNDEQSTRLQLDALKAAGCQRIFQDKLGGALRSRPQMDRALADLRAGDTLVVWKLDRLGRSLRNLLEIAETLHERDVALRSLTEHIDTATAAGKMLYSVLAPSRSSSATSCESGPLPGYAPHKPEVSTSGALVRSPLPKFERRARCLTAGTTPRMWRALCA